MSESSLSSSSSSSSKEFTPECSCDAIPDQINARIVVWEPEGDVGDPPGNLIQAEYTFIMNRSCTGAPSACNDGDWWGTYESKYIKQPENIIQSFTVGIVFECGLYASSFGVWWCNMTTPGGACSSASIGYFDCPPIQNPITANYGLGLPFVELEISW